MVIVNEAVTEWDRKGLKYKMTMTPVEKPIVLLPNKVKVVPAEDYIFRGQEGVVEIFHGTFDHPMCGIRVENGEPEGEYDSGTLFNVRNYMFGSSRYDNYIYVMTPPDLPGLFNIKRIAPWKWIGWLRLSIFNIDTKPHTCLGYGYQIVVTPPTPTVI